MRCISAALWIRTVWFSRGPLRLVPLCRLGLVGIVLFGLPLLWLCIVSLGSVLFCSVLFWPLFVMRGLAAHFQVSRDNRFEKEGYYTWIFLGSQRLSHLFTALIIIGFLLITCFPIWPRILKVMEGSSRALRRFVQAL